ncbi:proton-coupled amino acid transporter-like protein CG1139 [Bicyclus anynana]|uniref:Proton-coupled amino acid transporter-like protein CG1139 n=1 Tax=Bicyclus anynana TaxID=110368 RepID=A0ABM3LV40_BICAN|nr:proton-coupled amino acid transporter-like protein CG1139 [Bicyclus anynana]
MDETNGPPTSQTKTSQHRRRGHHKFEIKATGQAAKDYDFASKREPKKRTNVIETIGHIAKTCLGGGVVAIHESYKMCGLWSSFVLTLVFGFCISYAMYMIARSAQRMYGRVQVPSMSYPDLAQATLEIGPFQSMRKYSMCFRYMVDFTICFNLFGSCCVYQIMIARTIKQLVEGTNDVVLTGDPPLRVYILLLVIPCVCIGMITSLKYLAPFSIVADIIILKVACATVYYCIKSSPPDPFKLPVFKTVTGLFEFMGVCIFSMEGTGAVMAIENNMEKPKKIALALLGGMAIVVSIVVTIGFFGYWAFGEGSRSPVTINFPLSPFPIFLKCLFAIMIYVTYALNFWFPFELMWFYIKKKYNSEKFWFWERVYRAIFICGITIIATVFPNVSKFIGLLGSFCISNLGFIYPAFIELCLDWTDPGLGPGKWRLWRYILITVFGLILFVVGSITNIRGLIAESF